MLNIFYIRPLAVLLQPPIISSQAISLPLFVSSSLLYSKSILANGGLGLASVKLTLTKENDLKEWNYYLLQTILGIFPGGRGSSMLYSKDVALQLYFCILDRGSASEHGIGGCTQSTKGEVRLETNVPPEEAPVSVA
jgi:hypothetical protein